MTWHPAGAAGHFVMLRRRRGYAIGNSGLIVGHTGT
jgi:hypothetical protein